MQSLTCTTVTTSRAKWPHFRYKIPSQLCGAAEMRVFSLIRAPIIAILVLCKLLFLSWHHKPHQNTPIFFLLLHEISNSSRISGTSIVAMSLNYVYINDEINHWCMCIPSLAMSSRCSDCSYGNDNVMWFIIKWCGWVVASQHTTLSCRRRSLFTSFKAWERAA